MNKKSIVFYDGECGLCHKSVQILIRLDKQKKLYFCPLQKDYAHAFLSKYSLKFPYLSTLIFYHEDKIYEKSEAFLMALKVISVYKFLVKLSRIFPQAIRDFVYDIISKNRLYFFDKPTCEIPENSDPSRWI